MNKNRMCRIFLVIVCLVAILIVSSEGSLARAESVSPTEMVQRAWQKAQEMGSYSFLSDINQAFIPRPLPQMIGQQESILNMTLDGAVVLPDQAYSEMRVYNGQNTETVVMLRDGNNSFMLQDGELKPVENALNVALQSNDLMGYLAAADQVTLLDPPQDHPELVRYGFVIDGPRYAEYVRLQAENALLAEPGAPQGLTIKPMPLLQRLSGQGELWVNQAGLPVRQVLELNIPEVNDEYSARIKMSADFSSYGKVASLPKAVQGPDGKWTLQGTLTAEAASSLGKFPGFGQLPVQVAANEPENLSTFAGWWDHITSSLTLSVSPSGVVIFLMILLALVFIRYYRRYPKRCYAFIVFVLIPIMMFSPLLESAGMLRFMERQVQAAEASRSAVPDLLQALGLDPEMADEGDNQSDDNSGALSPQAALDQAIASKPDGETYYEALAPAANGSGQEALEICGYGEPGIDTDSDGLTDQVEYCLGTVADKADSDDDSIPDGTEVLGFDLGGQHWDSDPLNNDSNRDGIPDTREWSKTSTPNGLAASDDLDNDGVPNIWDEDDDGDDVPDAFDLSPNALTDYTTEFNLSTQGAMSTGTEAIEFEVQPFEKEHLRYSTTVLNWPPDEEGNIRDLNDSSDDLRLSPFLLVTTNVQPAEELLAQYSAKAWYDDEQGKYVLLVTLQPLEDGGAVYAFYGKVAYEASQTADIQWNAKFVWMAQMQNDTNVCHYVYSFGRNECEIEAEPTILHQYQETFRITGLQVTKSESYEAAVMGTPAMTTDDRYLFQLFVGLNNTYQDGATLEGQGSDETALEEIYSRFTNPAYLDNDYRTFDIPKGTVEMSEPMTYRNSEEGMADISNYILPNYLEYYPAFSSAANCVDGEHNAVMCATLVLASESHTGIEDLSDFRGADPRMVDLDTLNVNLDNTPVFAVRTSTLRMYEKDPDTLKWESMTPARMLEMIEARYHEIYATTLAEQYPSLRAAEARFIAYTGYLWAYGGNMTIVSVDGQILIPEAPDEAASNLNTDIANQLADNGLDYIGLASNLPAEFSDAFAAIQGTVDIIATILDRANLSNAVIGGKITLSGFAIAAAVASLIMNCLNTACAANEDLDMCDNETAFLVANILVGTFVITMQTIAITVQIVSAVIDHIAKVAASISAATVIMGFIGAAVGIVLAWVAFGLVAGTSRTSDPAAYRMSLGMAIVTTIWLIFLACLNFIPVIGPIISGILAILDYIIGLFTGLFTDTQWSFSRILLELFYKAETRTSIESAAFGEFFSSLRNPDMGLIGGNTVIFSIPASGVVTTVNRGNDDDLNHSYVKGDMQPEQDPADPADNPFTGEPEESNLACPITDGKAYCTNTAGVGFALEPKINGTASFVAKILYRWIWTEYMFYGSVKVNTHWVSGQLPEDDTYNTIYLDVLPPTLTELWNWSEITNPDRDGDGLTNDEELNRGTDPDLWDSDYDGLSDKYEVEVASERGADPKNPDTDGDGLNDAVERQVGTRINVADSDGDGLTDGQELRHVENGVLIGGWNITTLNPLSPTTYSGAELVSASANIKPMGPAGGYWVSSDPLMPDDDGDSLNATEEKLNGLSPQGRNALVPALQMSVTPIGEIPDARPGAFWLPGTTVTIKIDLVNIAVTPVTTTLSLKLPQWFDSISGGSLAGDRTPSMTLVENTMNWDFSGSNALQLYEAVSTTVTARVNPATTSGSDEITLDLLYDTVQMHKAVRVTVDGDNPAVSIIAPNDGAYLNGTSFVIGGTTVDRTTWITARSLSIVSHGNPPTIESLPLGQGPWAYTWMLPTTDGVYTIQASATDAMNHSGTSSLVNVTVDNTPPTITLNWQMVDNTVKLSGLANDNQAGVDWVQLKIDGQPWRNVTLNGADWSFDWAVSENAQGEHTVSVRAIDRSRNQSEIISETIVVDSIAPSSIVNVGADPDLPPAVKPDEAFTIAGVADEGGHLPLPAAPADLALGMDVFDDSTVWLGLSSIRDNDGGVLAAWIGDFNADRLSDLAVGLPGPAGETGQVALVYGQGGGWKVPPDLEMLAASPTRFTGSPNAQLGSYVAATGDVNSDARDDLLVAGRNTTDAYLVFGNPGVLGNMTLDSGQTGYRTLLRAPANIEALAAAGDVDGDGRADLLITAGGTAYLVMGRGNPWPETIDLATESAASFPEVTGATGVGDVDNDQRAEWVILATGLIKLQEWNTAGTAVTVTTKNTADAKPRAVALGYVDNDQMADWIYSDGSNPVLVYGNGTVHTFSNYGGLLAAPGDVDGDGWADILVGDLTDVATLIGQPDGKTPTEFASIEGVGGCANAPYATGADINYDGSADLVLIPSKAAAESHGFDAPDFTSGFVSPQMLQMGESTINKTGGTTQPLNTMLMPSNIRQLYAPSAADTRYVDDDQVCDWNSPCYQTIQAAVNASDGGGDTIIVYPGTYAAFNVPAGTNYDYLVVKGVSADAVFIDGSINSAVDAISIAADGVNIANLTVRNATNAINLKDGAGEATLAGGQETSINHLLTYDVTNSVNISQSAALELTDSTLVGNGVDPILKVGTSLNPAVHTWNTGTSMTNSIALNGGIVGTQGSLYAMPGGSDTTVYKSTPVADGTISSWTAAFRVPQEMPSTVGNIKRSDIVAGGNYFYQVHPTIATPDFGVINGSVNAVAIAPNGDIYVGGNFSFITGTTSNTSNIARWDGTTWHPLGANARNGVNGTVYAITILANNNVFVGGRFDLAYNLDGTSVAAQNIARWDGSQWLTLGQAVTLGNGVSGDDPVAGSPQPGTVYALAHSEDGYVFIGGNFRHYHASYNTYIAGEGHLWNFVVWKPDNTWGPWGYTNVGNSTAQYVRSLVWSGGNLFYNVGSGGTLYAGGSFIIAGDYSTQNVASFHYTPGSGNHPEWVPVGYFFTQPVADVAVDTSTGIVYAASENMYNNKLYHVFQYDPGVIPPAWKGINMTTTSSPVNALAADIRGNVFAGTIAGDFLIFRPDHSNISTSFDWLENEGVPIGDLVVDSRLPDRSGQVLVARGSTDTSQGGIKRWSMEGVFRYNLTTSTWQWITYPMAFWHEQLPTAIAADDAGNLYTAAKYGNYYILYRLKANSTTWELRASLSWYDLDPTLQFTLTDLVWANGYIYALAYSPDGSWNLFRHYPGAPNIGSGDFGPSTSWTKIGGTSLPSGGTTADTRSLIWDGVDSIYVLQASGYYRYRISSNIWDVLPSPTGFTLLSTQTPAIARAGNYLHVYATPTSGPTPNLFRYGAVGLPDVRLKVERTVFVEPSAATNLTWSQGSSYRFQIAADKTNAWVGWPGGAWSPALPADAPSLTYIQADFLAPEDNLYRVGASSLLRAGYHTYKAVVHVYTSEAECTECAGGELVWGELAFGTIREAVESGAARVLVHPGRYPQTFYLVSGVEVIGSGAESTIIEPPSGPASTLVTADGVAGVSLARLTLAGTTGWNGFIAEGGATGVNLTRNIFRHLNTAITLQSGSEVEIINNTIVENTTGILINDSIDDGTAVTVRNTILAFHSGTGLQHGTNPTALSSTYNDFWANGTDMNPEIVSLGSQFFDPLFRSLAEEDLRLAANSPLIDMGAPNDPTLPGGGKRVDIGYSEFNTAGFYVSKDYSANGLNDGLTWGIEAFNQIQPALDAAAASLHQLQGPLPEGGISVGVKSGTYTETVSVPSHVRLVGFGAESTAIDAGAAGSAVTFDAVTTSELSGFTILNAPASGAGIELKKGSSGILVIRNIIRSNASHGISLAGKSSANLYFNTIVSNTGAGVFATGPGAWADVRNSILDDNAIGLKAELGGLIRNDYNLLDNTANVDGVTLGSNTILSDPAFTNTIIYVPSASSPALDAAEPGAEVPQAGGLRADLGYKELIASPIALLFGPQIDPKITGNSGVALVELGVVKVADPSVSVTDTLPTTWVPLIPVSTDLPLFYWSKEWSATEPGFYRVYSKATDKAGNDEADPTEWYEGAFVVDNTAPTLTWAKTLPTTTDAAAVLAEVNATGTVSTPTGTRNDVMQVYFSVTDPVGKVKSYTAENGKAWIPLPVANSVTPYTITAVALDEAGNSTQTSTQVTVTPGTSVVTVTDPVSGIALNKTNLTIYGYVRFASPGTGTLSVYESTVVVQSITLDTQEQFSAWSAVTTLYWEGVKNIQITPKQNSVSGTPVTLSLLVDVRPPDITFDEPTTTVKQFATFFGHTDDYGQGTYSDMDKVEISVDGGYTWRQASLGHGNSQFEEHWGYVKWDLGAGQDFVSYPVQVRAIDKAGNIVVTRQVITTDDVPPSDLSPVVFSDPIGQRKLPVEQHVDQGTELKVDWNPPVDASGTAIVMAVVDQAAETTPTTVINGTSISQVLNATGDWYVHLLVKDAVGNTAVTHYGPWHVRNMTSTPLDTRRESIVVDGYLDIEHDEWQASELLGVDSRSGNPQELYLSVDGQNVFLGWSGAWWTLDGVLWAYLDMSPTAGAISGVDGKTLPADMTGADTAIEITAPLEGTLWSWNGSAWVNGGTLNFKSGPIGDTEVKLPWSTTSDHPLKVAAFALPRAAEEVPLLLAENRANKGMVIQGSPQPAPLDQPSFDPWAVFPTTNSLDESMGESFTWDSTTLDGTAPINLGQPLARTVYMTVTSLQAANAALCQQAAVTYGIQLENPEPEPISGLALILSTVSGVTLQGVAGAEQDGIDPWKFNVPEMAAGARSLVSITINMPADLVGISQIATTITLSAGETALTPESNASTTITNRVDGLAPTLTIDAPNGAAIAAAGHIFVGTANDMSIDGMDGSGVAKVEVSWDGSTWSTAQGTLAWSILLDPPANPTLSARAVDSCGNTSNEVTQSFIVDSTPPEVTWTAPVVVTEALVEVPIVVVDSPVGSQVRSVEVQLDGENNAWQPAMSRTGAWTWNWVTPQEDGASHSLRVRASDMIGNTTTTGWQPSIVDTIAPLLTVNQDVAVPLVINPLDGSVLTGTVSDGSGLKNVSILIYGVEGGTPVPSIPAQVIDLTGAPSWAYKPDLTNWAAGSYTLRVQAQDNNGNTIMQGPYIFKVTTEMLPHPEMAITTVTVDGTTQGDGLNILNGESIKWLYTVTNIGNAVLGDVTVSDSFIGVTPGYVSGDTNTDGKLDLVETWIFEASGTAAAGNYINTGTVVGTPLIGASVTAADESSYFGGDPQVAIDESTNVEGLTILPGTAITWTYTVTNLGNVPLSNVTVTDSVPGVTPAYKSGDTDGDGKLDKDETWIYEASGTTITGSYTSTGTASGSYSDSASHNRTVSGTDTSSYFGADPGFSVSVVCKANSEPIPQEGPAKFTAILENTGNVPITVTADGGIGTQTLAVGESRNFEVDQVGPFNEQETVSITIHATGAYTDDAETNWTELSTNQEGIGSCRVGSRVYVLKLTQGLIDPSKTWTFSIWAGTNGFNGTRLAAANTNGVGSGLLTFNNLNLDKDLTYTLCEENVPAGWTSFWQVDSTNDGNIDTSDAILIPYNPNAADNPPQDLGNRCIDFGDLTGVDLLTNGGTLLFKVDNTYPGGDPRSPGYWKNWNTVTGGGQAKNAERNGGYMNGFWLLEDVLAPAIGGGITWDDILTDDFLFPIAEAAVAVDILDQRAIGDPGVVGDGVKHSNDAAYTLAMHLMAAQLNFGAGARTCDAALDAALEGEKLLDKYNFSGGGDYLLSNNKRVKVDYALALQLANTLGQYNNSMLCIGPAVSFVGLDNGNVVAGIQTLVVNTLDTVPVTQVEFFIDEVSIGVDNVASDGWSIGWDTTGISDGIRTVKAVAINALAQSGSADVTVTVDNLPEPTLPKMHVGGLTGTTTPARVGKWNAEVTLTIHGADHLGLSGAAVSLMWSDGLTATCTTGSGGICTLTRNNIGSKVSSLILEVTNVTLSGAEYDQNANEKTVITLNKPQ